MLDGPENTSPDTSGANQDTELARRQELYKDHVSQAWENQNASSDELDKNLLTLSSGALGLSVAFIKDVVHLNEATHLALLIISWVCFSVCIAATLISFWFGIRAHAVQADYLGKYYLEGDESYFNKKNPWSLCISLCSVAGIVFFFLGIAATVAFVSINTWKGTIKMSDKKTLAQDARPPLTMTDARPAVAMTKLTEARVPTPMTPCPETRGRAPVQMTPVPKPQSLSTSQHSPSTKESK